MTQPTTQQQIHEDAILAIEKQDAAREALAQHRAECVADDDCPVCAALKLAEGGPRP